MRFHESQPTQRDFADRQGVGLSTLRKWLRGESNAASPPVKFQEVMLPNTQQRYALEVVSPQGWIVIYFPGGDSLTASDGNRTPAATPSHVGRRG